MTDLDRFPIAEDRDRVADEQVVHQPGSPEEDAEYQRQLRAEHVEHGRLLVDDE